MLAVILGLVTVVLGGAGRGDAGTAAAAASMQPAGPAEGSPPDVLPAGGSWTVTLVTGEVVEVTADAGGRVSATVREHERPYRTFREPDGSLHVIPLAVTPLYGDVLDPALFDVTGLVRQGYDDGPTDSVPLIVAREGGGEAPTPLRAGDERPLPSIGASALSLAKGDTDAAGALLAEAGGEADAAPGARAPALGPITRVWLDRKVTVASPATAGVPALAAAPGATAAAANPAAGAATGTVTRAGVTATPTQEAPALDHNLVQVGADRAWDAGLTGEGVTVAVLDTGIDATHPDIAGQIVAERNFNSNSTDTVDRNGHGTHVAGIAVGTGAGSGGARSGIAPGADLVVGKVLDDFGDGFESEIIAGMEWAAGRADVVNMSLGTALPSDGEDPVSLALENLSEATDTLFVVAAGNSGPVGGSIGSPGAANSALTVGAVDADDAVADFSSRGPIVDDRDLKPEVVAPGVSIVAARAAGTGLEDPVDELYTSVTGTSMAGPHVAGAAALLAQQHPDWTHADLKRALVGSADDIGADGYVAGSGRLDVGDAVGAEVRPTDDVVEVTLAHPHDEPHAEQVGWANAGTEPVTLDLAVALQDRQGADVAAVTVSPAEVTVGPGDTATATVTVDGPALDDGLYSGAVTAQAEGEDEVRLPLAVNASPEMAELTIVATPPEGGRTGSVSAFAAVINLDDAGLFAGGLGFGDRQTLSVPAGRYAVVGDVSTGETESRIVAQVGDPEVVVSGATTVVFDGTAAVPFHPTAAGVDTAPPMQAASYLTVTPDTGAGGYGFEVGSYAWYPMPTLRVTPTGGAGDGFSAWQAYRLQAPHLTVTAGDQPVEVVTVPGYASPPPEGEHTWPAFDGGDGTDLSGAEGRLAVVALPQESWERASITQRALDAGAAGLVFVDEEVGALTLRVGSFDPWADLPVVVAAGESAAALRAAAAAGEDVTVRHVASPYVYDIVTEPAPELEAEPVLSRREQAQLARIDEHFHRNAEGRGATSDRRYALPALMNLDSEGPLPEQRTARVTPGVVWQSIALGTTLQDFFGEGPELYDNYALSMDAGATYEPHSRTTLRWLRPPMAPNFVGGPSGASTCQPSPATRTVAGALQLWPAPFQDAPDRAGCADPLSATLTVERDGTMIEQVDTYYAEVPVPDEAGGYRVTLEQEGQAPYPHDSTTTWSFPSAAPTDGDDDLVPVLVADYELPLDTMNRPTNRVARVQVAPVTGTEGVDVDTFSLSTSLDGGATWRRAPALPVGGGTWAVLLPRVEEGTSVSLRLDAGDGDGNRIEQTLLDAYTA